MKRIRQKIKEQGQKTWRLSLLLTPLSLLFFNCTKVDYTFVEEPAYLRVFNSINYEMTLENKDGQAPYFCMIINPEFDDSGMPIGGEIIGDFLDQRNKYAPPYPSYIGNSTSVDNPEYPGKENVLVGPILNGFDLSSWAQVPSGKSRILFMYRPKNSIPFFELDNKLKRDVFIDKEIDLNPKEVYTLHLLQKDFATGETGIVLRQENFHKLPLSDSLVYVNFYNYSAEGFWQADRSLKPQSSDMASLVDGIKDDMNVYVTLYRPAPDLVNSQILRNHRSKYLGHVRRDLNNDSPATYYSFPLWADTLANGIYTDTWQRFELLASGLSIADNPYSTVSGGNVETTYGNFAAFNCVGDGTWQPVRTYFSNGTALPNLLVNVHSGLNNPQTFATVNTIEVINNYVYLTTVQRKYPAPIY